MIRIIIPYEANRDKNPLTGLKTLQYFSGMDIETCGILLKKFGNGEDINYNIPEEKLESLKKDLDNQGFIYRIEVA